MTNTAPKNKVITLDVDYEFPEVVDSENRITCMQNGQGVSAEIYLFNVVRECVPNDVEMLSE